MRWFLGIRTEPFNPSMKRKGSFYSFFILTSIELWQFLFFLLHKSSNQSKQDWIKSILGEVINEMSFIISETGLRVIYANGTCHLINGGSLEITSTDLNKTYLHAPSLFFIVLRKKKNVENFTVIKTLF